MTKQCWLIYARSGAEIKVADELRLAGIDVWCGRVLEGKPDPRRGGRKRITQWTERAALPNYIFATLTADEYHDVKGLKDVIGYVSIVDDAAQAGAHKFMARVDQAYTDAQRARERGEMAPPAFRPDQVLEAVGGPLYGLMVRYRGVVEGRDGYSIEADSILGRVKINPAHVRAAG